MEPTEANLRKDPVDRLVADLRAEEFVAWMVEYHGLPTSSAGTVTTNLREQLHWHRLRGRIDRWPAWAALAELLLRRRRHNAPFELPREQGYRAPDAKPLRPLAERVGEFLERHPIPGIDGND